MFSLSIMYVLIYCIVFVNLFGIFYCFAINSVISQLNFQKLIGITCKYLTNDSMIFLLIVSLSGLPPFFMFFLKLDVLIYLITRVDYIFIIFVIFIFILSIFFYVCFFNVFFIENELLLLITKDNFFFLRSSLFFYKYFFYFFINILLFYSYFGFFFFFDFYVILSCFID
jgi:NADH:ubiquinone oxidoreductase subunit 2 (subunit N)